MNDVCLYRRGAMMIPYGPEHDRQTVQWLNDPEMRATFGLSRTITIESHRLWLDNSRNVIIWAIVDEHLLHVGNVLLHCVWAHRSAYFQIYLGNREVRGEGIGSQVLDAVIEHAFGELGLNRIWLHTLAGNAHAEHLYGKAGFLPEGTERDAIFRDGSFHSQVRWSLLAREWHAGRKSSEP